MNPSGRFRVVLARAVLSLLGLPAGCWTPVAAAAEVVPVVLSERGGPYGEVVAELRGVLGSTAEVVEILHDELDSLASRRPRAVVAVGTQACRRAAGLPLSAPLVCTLVPRHAYETIAASASNPSTALVLDQPAHRQMALIRAALPDHRQVAVLLGGESMGLARSLRRAAAEHGLSLAANRAPPRPDDLYGALHALLAEADVLLALPDAEIYNSRTLQNILRAAFQKQIPLIAFSPAYVKAGALAAVYTTPRQIGRQTGQWLARFLEGRPLPAPQSPREFEVSVNPNVARALGIAVAAEADIAERMRRMEQPR